MAAGAKKPEEQQGWRKRWLRSSPRQQSFLSSVLGENPTSESGNPYANYLSRSVLLEEASPPKNVRATINIIVGAIAAFVVWASVTKLDERAQAPGNISPVSFLYPVQHFEGGIVGETLVENGDFVNKGDPLIILDQTAPRAQYEANVSRNIALKLQIERLRAFALGRPARFEEVPPGYQHFVDDQRAILSAQIDAREAQINVINAQVSEVREEIKGLRDQEATLEEEVRLVQEEVEIYSQLIDRGLTKKVTYLSAQRDLAQARGSLLDVRSRITRAEASIREASGRILEIEQRLRNEAFKQMGTVSSEQAQVQAQVGLLEDRLERTSITAPITGRVSALLERSPGGVIGPGEILMEIVPTEQELIAEIRISPRDIGHLEEGLEVLVKIETYNYARYGGIKGILTNISAASYKDAEENTFFTAEVVLERNYVGMDPRSNQIRPDMTLIADIKTGEKTLMAYLMRPVYNTLQDSFAER